MPIPDDAFFEEWEATVTPEDRPLFYRDGVLDEGEWERVPPRVLFILPEGNLLGNTEGARRAKQLGDARKLARESEAGADFGDALARWKAMLIDGLSQEEAAALTSAELERQRLRAAEMNLKKIGGKGQVERKKFVPWVRTSSNRKRSLEEVQVIAPEVIVLCGDYIREEWPRTVTGKIRRPKEWRQRTGVWQGRLWAMVPHPSAGKYPTYRGVKNLDAPVAAFAASPEVAALRRG